MNEDSEDQKENSKIFFNYLEKKEFSQVMDNLNTSYNLPNLSMMESNSIAKPLPSFNGALREENEDDTIQTVSEENWEQLSNF